MSNSRVRASQEGLKKLNAIRDANKWSYRQIEDTVLAKTSDTVSQDRIMAFFKGENIYKSNALLICNALGFELDDIIQNHTKTINKNDINWTEKCNKILISRRELAINLFTSDMGITIELDQIHVPLGLIERKKKSKIAEDVETEQGSRIYQNLSEETTTKIPYSIFESEVLPEFKSSSNRIISILGEAGSGKTIQLLKISQWILEQGDLPIFISLGSIQIKENIKEVKPLLDYLFDDWLKQFSYQVPNQWIKDLELQLQQGKVWLLLDGADEIVGYSDPLGYLSKSLSIPLFQNVKVIITCRSNLWEIGANALSSLSNKTYRMMRFEYGDNNVETDTVSQFIDQWFKSSNRDLGQALRQALDEPGRERIRDLVTHPLMLSLLCFSWQYSDGKLPDTRASLYKDFADAIYELKKDKFFVDKEDRFRLEEVLGKLALESIEKGYKSILPYEFVNKTLQKPCPQLFELAIKLNWLNDIGVKSNTRQPVYAFFHPSFQEYFAALEINEHHFFLKHDLQNIKNGVYRILDKKWQEVFLLWLGLDQIETREKIELYKEILSFDCGCEGLYASKLIILASLGLDEFQNPYIDEVIVRLIELMLAPTYHPKYNPCDSNFNYFDSLVNWDNVEFLAMKILYSIKTSKVNELVFSFLDSKSVESWDYLYLICSLSKRDLSDDRILGFFTQSILLSIWYEIKLMDNWHWHERDRKNNEFYDNSFKLNSKPFLDTFLNELLIPNTSEGDLLLFVDYLIDNSKNVQKNVQIIVYLLGYLVESKIAQYEQVGIKLAGYIDDFEQLFLKTDVALFWIESIARNIEYNKIKNNKIATIEESKIDYFQRILNQSKYKSLIDQKLDEENYDIPF